MCAFHANECSYTSCLLITEEHAVLRVDHGLFNQSFSDDPLCSAFIDSVSVITLLCTPCTSDIHFFPSLLLEVVVLIKCTFNILVPVVKLCFSLNVFPSISSFPSSYRALLTGLSASHLLPLQRQEYLAQWTAPVMSITHFDDTPLPTG